MRKSRHTGWCTRLAMALLLAGCGSDAPATQEAADAAPIGAGAAFTDIPREQLYGASPAENLWSPKYELEVPGLPQGWNGVRLAILSDFHLGLWEENEGVVGEAIQRAAESEAELIVLLGDYVDSVEDIPALREVLAPLRGKNVLAVLGDRDIRSDSLAAQITSALRENGGGAASEYQRRNRASGGDTSWIAGLDPELLGSGFGDQQYILATVGRADRTPILLSHVPALATRAPVGKFPVVLSGNTFCGDVEVPAAPRLSWLATEALPGGAVEGIENMFRVQGGTVLVTCGLGYGFVPIRFGSAPEVPILTLRRAGGVPADSLQAGGGGVADSTVERFQGAAATGDTL